MYYKQGKRSRVDRKHCHFCGKRFYENESKSMPAGKDYFVCNSCDSTHVTHAVASSEAFTSPSGVLLCNTPASEDGGKEDYSLLKDHRFFSCDAPSPTPSHRLKAYLEAVWTGDEAVRKYHERRGR